MKNGELNPISTSFLLVALSETLGIGALSLGPGGAGTLLKFYIVHFAPGKTFRLQILKV